MREFCDSMRPLAAERGLFLHCEGPESLIVAADSAKVRRIAQNLVLNALNATERGGVRVTWEKTANSNVSHWMLSIQDTGPGFTMRTCAGPRSRIEGGYRQRRKKSRSALKLQAIRPPNHQPPQTLPTSPARTYHVQHGEGIGLSIVKRLCEVLDASLELESDAGKGTTFRVTFPARYPK